MALTALVKDELSRLQVTKPCCRKAEVSAMLRFAGGLHIVGGRIVVEAELDTAAAARRLRRDIAEVFGHTSDIVVLAPGGLRRASRYVVRVVRDGESLARQTGLLDGRGRPVRGLPPQVVSGATCDAEAAWRGAFLAHGSLTEPGPLVGARGHLPGPGGGAGARRRGPAARHRLEGARRPRGRPGRDPRRRHHRRHAHPPRRARHRAGLGGAPDAPRGPRHREPARELRRREPAPLGAGGRRRRQPGRARDGDPRRGRCRSTCGRPGSCGSSTSRRASRSSASSPTRR